MSGHTVQPFTDRKSFTTNLAAAVRKKFALAVIDTDTDAALIASNIGLSPTLVESWYKLKHPPLYLLAHPLVPDKFRLRILGDVLQMLPETTGGQSCETATAMLISIASEALAGAGRALTDGRVDESERRSLRPLIASLRDRCDRWLREHGDDAGTVTTLRGAR